VKTKTGGWVEGARTENTEQELTEELEGNKLGNIVGGVPKADRRVRARMGLGQR